MNRVEIKDISYLGKGVADLEGYKVFVDGGITGDILEIELYDRKKRFGLARIKKIIKPSPHRVQIDSQPLDNIPLQFLDYDMELELKKTWLLSTLNRNFGVEKRLVGKVIGMDNPLGYRNKAQIPIRSVKNKIEIGIFKNGSREFIPVNNFYIYDKEINDAAIIIRDIFNELNLSAYDVKKKTGLIKNLIIRRGHYTKELMIVLVVSKAIGKETKLLIKKILEQLPNTVSIIENINPQQDHNVMGKKSNILFGEDRYYDRLFDYKFAISSKSFYQVNTIQTEILYKAAIKGANIQAEEVWLDAYSGIGTMSLMMARRAKFVYGIELIKDAVEMAKFNQRLNEVDNVTFIQGKVEEKALSIRKLDGIMVDPPRAGLDDKFIEFILSTRPNKLVYVSCNPITLGQDLKKLTQLYKIKLIQPVDMFPRTPHIESITVLVRRDEKYGS